MPRIESCTQIPDVQIMIPQWMEDERGRFCEAFRAAWFPQRKWQEMQCNRSESRAGVLRGLHYHFRQADYWQLLNGTMQVGLADLRRSSPSFLQSAVLEMSAEEGTGLYIPPGVAHGFLSLTPIHMMYVVDRYYDGSDEHGVAWDDPDLAVAWRRPDPLLSQRDRANPPWQGVPPELRPR